MTNVVLGDIVTLQDRGKYSAVLGGTWGIASVVGPLVGGLLTDKASWSVHTCPPSSLPPRRHSPASSSRCAATPLLPPAPPPSLPCSRATSFPLVLPRCLHSHRFPLWPLLLPPSRRFPL